MKSLFIPKNSKTTKGGLKDFFRYIQKVFPIILAKLHLRLTKISAPDLSSTYTELFSTFWGFKVGQEMASFATFPEILQVQFQYLICSTLSKPIQQEGQMYTITVKFFYSFENFEYLFRRFKAGNKNQNRAARSLHILTSLAKIFLWAKLILYRQTIIGKISKVLKGILREFSAA